MGRWRAYCKALVGALVEEHAMETQNDRQLILSHIGCLSILLPGLAQGTQGTANASAKLPLKQCGLVIAEGGHELLFQSNQKVVELPAFRFVLPGAVGLHVDANPVLWLEFQVVAGVP